MTTRSAALALALPALGIFALGAGCNGDKGSDTGTETGTDTDTDTDTDTTDPTTSTGATRVATILALTPDHAAGADVYAQICQSCHAADGTGSLTGADLTERLPTLTEDEVVATVLDGKGNMDSYASLTNQEIADVVSHVWMFVPTMR